MRHDARVDIEVADLSLSHSRITH